MDFAHSPKVQELQKRVTAFMEQHVFQLHLIPLRFTVKILTTVRIFTVKSEIQEFQSVRWMMQKNYIPVLICVRPQLQYQ